MNHFREFWIGEEAESWLTWYKQSHKAKRSGVINILMIGFAQQHVLPSTRTAATATIDIGTATVDIGTTTVGIGTATVDIGTRE